MLYRNTLLYYGAAQQGEFYTMSGKDIIAATLASESICGDKNIATNSYLYMDMTIPGLQ